MKNILFKGKKYFLPIIIFLFVSFILGIIYLLGNFSYEIIKTILFILLLIVYFILGYNFSQNRSDKAIISGLKFSFIIILILFILGLIFKSPFHLSRLIYYLLIILVTILGAIISKNQKR